MIGACTMLSNINVRVIASRVAAETIRSGAEGFDHAMRQTVHELSDKGVPADRIAGVVDSITTLVGHRVLEHLDAVASGYFPE